MLNGVCPQLEHRSRSWIGAWTQVQVCPSTTKAPAMVVFISIISSALFSSAMLVAAFVPPLTPRAPGVAVSVQAINHGKPTPGRALRASIAAEKPVELKTHHLQPQAAPFDLNRYLIEKKRAVEVALDQSLQVTTPEIGKITEAMRYSLLAGGKRIRPIMCIAACEMAGGTMEQAMPTAVALEMIHTMSLIHDDLPSMDNDSLRRGKPTNHVIYGEDMAILAGDALLSTAFEHVAKHTQGVSADRIVEVIGRLGASVGAIGLAGGQVMDLECEGKSGVGLRELTWIHTHKTATLLKVSVASGAILGGATLEQVKACDTYALDIGLAFQVADDILDCTASSEALGKTAGKDVDTGKTTYPKLLGLEGSRQEARRLVREAKEALGVFGKRAEPLLAIADYIVERDC